MAETKQEKFERLAERRVSELIDKIRLVGNLSDRKNYAYSAEHVQMIFEVVESELKNAKSKFRDPPEERKSGFSFSRLRSRQSR